MASRGAINWLWRDLRMVFVLLVWAAFGVSLFYYFDGDALFRHAAPPPPQQGHSNNDKVYTGSIIVEPLYGDRCWQMKIDNRTGRMWETGYVSCYSAIGELAKDKKRGPISAVRIKSIMDAFRGKGVLPNGVSLHPAAAPPAGHRP
jgi:hypothetical protein